jgi:hypothetical protein
MPITVNMLFYRHHHPQRQGLRHWQGMDVKTKLSQLDQPGGCVGGREGGGGTGEGSRKILCAGLSVLERHDRQTVKDKYKPALPRSAPAQHLTR